MGTDEVQIKCPTCLLTFEIPETWVGGWGNGAYALCYECGEELLFDVGGVYLARNVRIVTPEMRQELDKKVEEWKAELERASQQASLKLAMDERAERMRALLEGCFTLSHGCCGRGL